MTPSTLSMAVGATPVPMMAPPEVALGDPEAALEIGFSISLSGIVTFKNAVELRKIAEKIPIERMLVETDSPYLAPVPHRGRRNEPSFVADTAAFIAQLRGITIEELAEKTTDNFFKLFAKTVRPATPAQA